MGCGLWVAMGGWGMEGGMEWWMGWGMEGGRGVKEIGGERVRERREMEMEMEMAKQTMENQ